MKKVVLSLIFLALSFQQAIAQKQKIRSSADGRCIENSWELAFEDDFNGNALDLNVWKMSEYSQGSIESDGSEEYYSLDNITVENGICKLIPKKETVVKKAISWQPDSMKMTDGIVNLRTYHYTSAFMQTRQEFHYGKYEIRCKIPKGRGFWPAFWMYGEKAGVNNEIDVFEFWNPENAFGKVIPKKLSMEHHMTVHYNHQMSGKKYTGPDYSLDYHVFTVVWDSTKIEWYVDGDLKRVTTQYLTKRGKPVLCSDIKASHTYVINPVFPVATMAILANIAVQSGKNGPDENTFNAPAYEIDYIRFYKPIPK